MRGSPSRSRTRRARKSKSLNLKPVLNLGGETLSLASLSASDSSSVDISSTLRPRLQTSPPSELFSWEDVQHPGAVASRRVSRSSFERRSSEGITVQSASGLFTRVGGRVEKGEAPKTRRDAKILLEDFSATMQKVLSSNTDPGVEMGESDWYALEGEVDSRFSERETLHGLLDKSGPGSLASADLGAFFVELVGMDSSAWSSAKSLLAHSLYIQKQVDLTIGKLAEQLDVSCSEHGHLQRELRSNYSMAFHNMSRLFSDALWYLEYSARALQTLKTRLDEKEREHKKEIEESASKHSQALKALREDHEEFRREVMADAEASAVENARLRETLRTLNDIFKNIQGNAETTSANDLYGKLKRLETQLAEKEAELTELRKVHLQFKNNEVTTLVAQKEAAAAREEHVALETQLREKDSLIQMFMTRETERLADEEAAKADEAEKVEDKEEEQEQEEEDCIGEDELQAQMKKGKDEIMSKLFLRWKKQLDDEMAVVLSGAKTNKPRAARTRKLCFAFRMLLPNLGSDKPQRDVAWTRKCMRAIVNAKMREHQSLYDPSITKTPQVELAASRFPEFVYAWFTPPAKVVMELELEKDRQKMFEASDEDRWGFYYGLKALSRESAEAKLLYTLLDEAHGEDYQAFFLHVLAATCVAAGNSLRAQWDAVAHAPTCAYELQGVEDAADVENADGGSQETDDDGDAEYEALRHKCRSRGLNGGQETLWIELSAALGVTKFLYKEGIEEHANLVRDAVLKLGVSAVDRLPEHFENADPANRVKCVDLYLFLRIAMHMYREEQVRRRAALRLMFETAGAAPLTNDNADSVTLMTAAPESPESAHVDFPQLVGIMRALQPNVSEAACASVFRDAFELGEEKVTLDSFVRVAEMRHFFTSTLRLPPHHWGHQKVVADATVQSGLRAAVHFHFTLHLPLFKRIGAKLPEEVRARLEAHFEDVGAALRDGSGVRALYSHRRLLVALLQLRMHQQEESALGPCSALDGKSVHPNRVVPFAEREMGLLSEILTEFQVEPKAVGMNKLRKQLAIYKTQCAWRGRLARLAGAPLSVILRMRPGYVTGRGAILKRRVYYSPRWTTDVIAEFVVDTLASLCGVRTRGSDNSPQWSFAALRRTEGAPVSKLLSHLLLKFFVKNFGVLSVAERLLHDLFFNVRALAQSSSRARLFAVFSGVEPERNPEDVQQAHREPSILCGANAFGFYLQAVTIVAILLAKGRGAPRFFANMEFSATGRASWQAPSSVLQRAANALLKGVVGSRHAGLVRFLAKTDSLKKGERDLVDVDDWLWLLMAFWSNIATEGIKSVKRVVETASEYEIDSLLACEDSFAAFASQLPKPLFDWRLGRDDDYQTNLYLDAYTVALNLHQGSKSKSPREALDGASRYIVLKAIDGETVTPDVADGSAEVELEGLVNAVSEANTEVDRRATIVLVLWNQFKGCVQDFLRGLSDPSRLEQEGQEGEGEGEATNILNLIETARTAHAFLEDQEEVLEAHIRDSITIARRELNPADSIEPRGASSDRSKTQILTTEGVAKAAAALRQLYVSVFQLQLRYSSGVSPRSVEFVRDPWVAGKRPRDGQRRSFFLS